MVKATELRIGNWVLSKETNPAHYHTITCNDMGDFFESIRDSLDPIPLTLEISEECRKVQPDICESFHLWLRNDGVYLEQYSEGIVRLPHIKYLHQVQNLFHALSGKELNVQL